MALIPGPPFDRQVPANHDIGAGQKGMADVSTGPRPIP
jgi:hypothetical protein